MRRLFTCRPADATALHNITYSFIANCQTAVVHKNLNKNSSSSSSSGGEQRRAAAAAAVGISALIPLVLSHCWQGFGSHPAYRNLVIFPKGSLLEQVEERSQGNWLTQVDLEGSH